MKEFKLTNNLARWAADMDTPEKRDFIFVYVWTLSRVLSRLACKDSADCILMEGEMTARVMDSLDRGRYKGTGSFMGWLFMQALSTIRDVGFDLYRQMIPAVRLVDEWDKSSSIADSTALPDEARLREEVIGWLDWFEEEEVSRLLNMVYVQEMSIAAASSVLGISASTASAWHKAAIEALTEALYVD